VLACEAAIDPETFRGWRVTVTGQADLIRDPDEIAAFTLLCRGGRSAAARASPSAFIPAS